MFSYDLKFLTNTETLYLKNCDFKSYKYENKKKLEESQYDIAKRSYCERRGGHWRSSKPQQLRQLESKLHDKNIVFCEWINDSIVSLVFSSGVISYITIKLSTLDASQILFDKYLIGKLNGQTVTAAVLCEKLVLFTHPEKIATIITFGKNNGNVLSQISDREPYLQTIELSGNSRRTERHVSWSENTNCVRILIWGATISEPAPWSPVLEDHANLHLYQVTGHQVTLTAYHQLENEILFAELSRKHDQVVHIAEQVSCHKLGVSLMWLRYEVPLNNRENRVIDLASLSENVVRASLPAPARVARRSQCGSKLLVACIDASIHIVHHTVGLTHSTKAGFIATEVRWAGELVLAAEEAGRLQCFDRALSLLHHHTKCLDLTSYMREPKRVQILATRPGTGGPLILATLAGGPLALLRITHARLLSAWIRSNRTNNAVALVRAMDWGEEGEECLRGVGEVVRHALRARLAAVGERGVQLALGAFLAPAAPLPPAAARYAPAVHDLARKFFHHLLRRGRVEKALRLAVDLAAWDVFADVRHAAAARALPALAREAAAAAAAARRLAPDSECSDSCSQCSSHSSSESERSNSRKVKTNPPPLPRVSLPSILTVPINQTDTYTTTSIRPNLHQYLDRDNTIWSKDIKDDSHLAVQNREHQNPAMGLNVRWNSVDNVISLQKTKAQKKTGNNVIDVTPQSDQERITSHFRRLYQNEIKEEANEHFITNVPSTNSNFSVRYRQDWTGEKPGRNKVKFSDTITVAVVPESLTPNPVRELADSLPLSPPHKYLSVFAHPPAPAMEPPGPGTLPQSTPTLPPARTNPPIPTGTTLDYVEV